MSNALKSIGFKCNLVLADSLDGESGTNFRYALAQMNLDYIVAICSNHDVELLKGQHTQYLEWQRFQRVFSKLDSEHRFIRAIIRGKRSEKRSWQIPTDRDNLPGNSPRYVMSKYPVIGSPEVGNFYRLRNWVEYGLNQSKNHLGWADYCLTHYPHIERCARWEIVRSSYLLVSLHSEQMHLSTLLHNQNSNLNLLHTPGGMMEKAGKIF